jgi:hypothetical protein
VLPPGSGSLRDRGGGPALLLATAESNAGGDDPREPEQVRQLAEVVERCRGGDERDRGNGDRAPAEQAPA